MLSTSLSLGHHQHPENQAVGTVTVSPVKCGSGFPRRRGGWREVSQHNAPTKSPADTCQYWLTTLYIKLFHISEKQIWLWKSQCLNAKSTNKMAMLAKCNNLTEAQYRSIWIIMCIYIYVYNHIYIYNYTYIHYIYTHTIYYIYMSINIYIERESSTTEYHSVASSHLSTAPLRRRLRPHRVWWATGRPWAPASRWATPHDLSENWRHLAPVGSTTEWRWVIYMMYLVNIWLICG